MFTSSRSAHVPGSRAHHSRLVVRALAAAAAAAATGLLAACGSPSSSQTDPVPAASVDFTNTSAKACGMYGYPGVSFVTAGLSAGQQVGPAAQRAQGFAKVAVQLAPGGTAHAWLKVAVAADYPASSCHPVTVRWLRIYPPGDTAAGYAGHTVSACSSAGAPLLTVLPVRAGLGSQNVTP